MRTLINSPEFEASLGRKFKDPSTTSSRPCVWPMTPSSCSTPARCWVGSTGSARRPTTTRRRTATPGRIRLGRPGATQHASRSRGPSAAAAATLPCRGRKERQTGLPPVGQSALLRGHRAAPGAATSRRSDQAGSPQEWATFLLSSPSSCSAEALARRPAMHRRQLLTSLGTLAAGSWPGWHPLVGGGCARGLYPALSAGLPARGL
jgi:hypothetical protein